MIRQSGSVFIFLLLIVFGNVPRQVFAVVFEIPVYIAGQETPYIIRYRYNAASGRESVKYCMVNLESWDYQSLRINSSENYEIRMQELHDVFSNAKEFELEQGSTPCFFSLWSMHSQRLQREIINCASSVSQEVKNDFPADRQCVLFPVVPLFFCHFVKYTEDPTPNNGLFISRISFKNRVVSYVQVLSGFFETGDRFSDDKIMMELEIRLKEYGGFDALNINFPHTGKSWIPDKVARINPYQPAPEVKNQYPLVNQQRFSGWKKETSAIPEYCLPGSGLMFCCPMFVGCVLCGGLIFVHSSFPAAPFTAATCLVDEYNIAVTLSAGFISASSKFSAGAGICSMVTGACGSCANILSIFCYAGNYLRKYYSAPKITDNDLSGYIGQLAVTPYNYDVYLKRFSESPHSASNEFRTTSDGSADLFHGCITTTTGSHAYMSPASLQPIPLKDIAAFDDCGRGRTLQVSPFQTGRDTVVNVQPSENKKSK